MKITFFILLAFFLQVNARTFSQQTKVSLKYENVELSKVLKALEKQTNLYFFFNDEVVNTSRKVSVSVKGEALETVLNNLFGDGYSWDVVNNMIVLKSTDKQAISSQAEKVFKVSGRVTDEKMEPLPGVTVLIKSTTLGVATDVEGRYVLAVPEGRYILVFTMVGMEPREVSVSILKDEPDVNVVLRSAVSELEGVVVTGIFKKAKESYTGAVSTVSQEQLKMYKGQNLLQTLKNIDVSLNLSADNINGSNPNSLPQVNIRGNSSLPSSLQEYNESTRNDVNTPLIIMDGFEISLERLMDYNDEEISSINILKDAASTAIYGSRGSNGVIVVITKQPEVGKLRVSAEVGIDIEAPDISSYDLLDASQKLELEKSLDLYSSSVSPMSDVLYKEAYNKRLRDVLSGTDTDWLSKPLRTGVGSHYNLRLEGGSDEFRWSATTAYKDVRGVMDGSFRRNFNGAIVLMYKMKDFTFKNYASYGINRSMESKYGEFSTYVEQQPYNAPYDDKGKLVRYFDGFYRFMGDVQNPLFDATLNSFDKAGYTTLTDNFSVEWMPLDGLTVRGLMGVTTTENTGDVFLPAEHSTFTEDPYYSTDEGFLRRGSYTYRTGRDNSYTGNLTLSYSKIFRDKHQFYVGVDYSLSQSESYNYKIVAEGFTNEDINFLASARQYAKDDGPSGSKSKLRRFGLTGNVNYIYDNRYYVDASFRMDGSSVFGSEKKYAPFWSTGVGWNLHNERFLEDYFINVLRMKFSYGQTGTMQGASTGVSTIYKYVTDNRYMHWTGGVLQGWGNPFLTWQKTDEFNAGMEFALWQGRVKGEFNVYMKKTGNLLSYMDIPHSMGFSSYLANVGEVKNRGWELSASAYLIRDTEREMNWMVGGQLVYNKNYISKLSDAIKAQNTEQLMKDVDISNLFYEGRPQNAIYGVRSLGIDPSNGKEVFLDKDGNETDIWNPSDKVYLGSKDPKFRGNMNTMFMWKGLSLNLSFGFYWGGKVYNQTLVDRVEVTKNSLMLRNVDARVYHARWQNPGDVVSFRKFDNNATRATSRFVMDDNVFEIQSAGIQYKWNNVWMQKYVGLTSLTFGVNMSDLWYFSTVKRERGTSYPYARNVQASVKFLF